MRVRIITNHQISNTNDRITNYQTKTLRIDVFDYWMIGAWSLFGDCPPQGLAGLHQRALADNGGPAIALWWAPTFVAENLVFGDSECSGEGSYKIPRPWAWYFISTSCARLMDSPPPGMPGASWLASHRACCFSIHRNCANGISVKFREAKFNARPSGEIRCTRTRRRGRAT